ncbi:hypothetical protein BAUCODRAFT_75502 [Baudoinia panamericana UAMH 10762]|uniref:Diaminohydroxyphosphoribosylamino-pyrimidine deaminase n=1 Tax=Baudoinia panamericana (strain UAMH 10762) TaxID=717646 RepID=M2MAG3_BAUPA|nr:uncharacterized protein BAUCODRAFT_75502 [Baudoinia panamericana UAMH 10762]EMC93461.1 hypothetical protein BAUCODRAFT_75502 [Baudoinia panamericana UAMH 10762]
MDAFSIALGDEVTDADDETFDLFSQGAALSNLGMLDAKAEVLEVCIADRDYTITQSPGILQSGRQQGTTGAAVWQTSIRLASWLALPKNVLFKDSILGPESVVLELGAGIAGLVAMFVAPKVRSYVATDQQHLLKLLQANIDQNTARVPRVTPRNGRRPSTERCANQNIKVLALDWEEDDVPKHLSVYGLGEGVDVVLASDCIFNYALIPPFVQACVEVCSLRKHDRDHGDSEWRPTVCLVAQQLRQSEVFEQFLNAFMKPFRVWRVPDGMISKDLGGGSGFAIHVGILR